MAAGFVARLPAIARFLTGSGGKGLAQGLENLKIERKNSRKSWNHCCGRPFSW